MGSRRRSAQKYDIGSFGIDRTGRHRRKPFPAREKERRSPVWRLPKPARQSHGCSKRQRRPRKGVAHAQSRRAAACSIRDAATGDRTTGALRLLLAGDEARPARSKCLPGSFSRRRGSARRIGRNVMAGNRSRDHDGAGLWRAPLKTPHSMAIEVTARRGLRCNDSRERTRRHVGHRHVSCPSASDRAVSCPFRRAVSRLGAACNSSVKAQRDACLFGPLLGRGQRPNGEAGISSNESKVGTRRAISLISATAFEAYRRSASYSRERCSTKVAFRRLRYCCSKQPRAAASFRPWQVPHRRAAGHSASSA